MSDQDVHKTLNETLDFIAKLAESSKVNEHTGSAKSSFQYPDIGGEGGPLSNFQMKPMPWTQEEFEQLKTRAQTAIRTANRRTQAVETLEKVISMLDGMLPQLAKLFL